MAAFILNGNSCRRVMICYNFALTSVEIPNLLPFTEEACLTLTENLQRCHTLRERPERP